MLKLTWLLLQLGTWVNGLSYFLVAMTNCPNPLFKNSPVLDVPPGDGEDNIYTKISMAGLMFVTGPCIIFGLIFLLVGCINHSDDEKNKKKTK